MFTEKCPNDNVTTVAIDDLTLFHSRGLVAKHAHWATSAKTFFGFIKCELFFSMPSNLDDLRYHPGWLRLNWLFIYSLFYDLFG